MRARASATKPVSLAMARGVHRTAAPIAAACVRVLRADASSPISIAPLGVLDMDPEFLNADGEHVHDERVSSVGFNQPGELDMDKTNSWIAKLLQLEGNNIYRYRCLRRRPGRIRHSTSVCAAPF